MSALRPLPRRRGGFTLVEIAVTLLIISIGLTLCVESLFTAKHQAAHTRNLKLARELGTMTLGQIESGMYQEELQSGWSGSYAQEGYPDFYFDVLLGDDMFEEQEVDVYDDSGFHDTFADRRERQEEARREADEDEEEVEEPFERVKLRVTFPKTKQFKNQLVLESWMPWEQVYGPDEDESGSTPSGSAR
ncbi:MAG: type II secretion system protein [Planctomycetes bacterium]|nr:type II secretion system protein [Planctomycetota bacterium]